MEGDDKLALWKHYWQLPIGQKWALVGIAAAVGIGGFKLGGWNAQKKIEKVEVENARLVSKFEAIEADPNPKNCEPQKECTGVILALDESVVKTSRINELQGRADAFKVENARLVSKIEAIEADPNPKNCEPQKECTGIVLTPGQEVVQSAVLKELQDRPTFCALAEKKATECTLRKRTPTCLNVDRPENITDRFEDYADEKNEKLFRDLYAGKWICDPGWKLRVLGLPEKNREDYWTVSATPADDNFGSFPTVQLVLQEGFEMPDWMEKDVLIRITGKLVRARTYGVSLVEGELKKAE